MTKAIAFRTAHKLTARLRRIYAQQRRSFNYREHFVRELKLQLAILRAERKMAGVVNRFEATHVDQVYPPNRLSVQRYFE